MPLVRADVKVWGHVRFVRCSPPLNLSPKKNSQFQAQTKTKKSQLGERHFRLIISGHISPICWKLGLLVLLLTYWDLICFSLGTKNGLHFGQSSIIYLPTHTLSLEWPIDPKDNTTITYTIKPIFSTFVQCTKNVLFGFNLLACNFSLVEISCSWETHETRAYFS